MGLNIWACLLLFAGAATAHLSVQNVEGYYWRDYKYDIPPDAVPGGRNRYEKTTYIGQALHKLPNGKLIPGTIDPDHKGQMTYAWNDDQYTTSDSMKILCSQHHDNFMWTSTDIVEVKRVPRDNFVLGGFDTDYPLYIGSVHSHGQIVVGKVTLQEPYDAFGYAVDGNAYFIKTQFEILSYKAHK